MLAWLASTGGKDRAGAVGNDAFVRSAAVGSAPGFTFAVRTLGDGFALPTGAMAGDCLTSSCSETADLTEGGGAVGFAATGAVAGAGAAACVGGGVATTGAGVGVGTGAAAGVGSGAITSATGAGGGVFFLKNPPVVCAIELLVRMMAMSAKVILKFVSIFVPLIR